MSRIKTKPRKLRTSIDWKFHMTIQEVNMFSLKDQVAIVTGGANGIGKGIAGVLAKAGAHVVIADIDSDAGKRAAEELNGTFEKLDVTDREACQRVVDGVVERFGRLDILCSNTGIFPQATLDIMTLENWEQMMAVNLRSTFFMVQAALPAMR
ncbi:MAG: SDR family NAD(P)-dependent oxidoreductase, partial [Dokdonella sp.]